MALVGSEGSPVWDVPAGHKDSQADLKVGLEKVVLTGHKDSQVGPKVGLEKVVLAGCRVVQPGLQ